MTRKEYKIKEMPEYTSIVYETKRQKDILDILDEMNIQTVQHMKPASVVNTEVIKKEILSESYM